MFNKIAKIVLIIASIINIIVSIKFCDYISIIPWGIILMINVNKIAKD